MFMDFSQVAPPGGVIVFPDVVPAPMQPTTQILEMPVMQGTSVQTGVFIGGTVSDLGQPPET
jgi:hypothetical protein